MAINFGAARAASKKRKAASALSAPPTAAPEASSSSSQAKAKATSEAVAAPRAKKTKLSQMGQLKWKNIVLPSEIGFDEDGGMLELDEVEGVEVVYADGLVKFKVADDGDDDEAELVPAKPSKKAKKAKAAPAAALSEAVDESPFADEDLSAFVDEDDAEDASPEVVSEDDAELEEEDEEAVPAAVVEAAEPAKLSKKAEGKRRRQEEKAAADAALLSTMDETPFDVEAELPLWAPYSLPLPIFRSLAELKFTKPTAIQERALSVEIGSKPFVDRGSDDEHNASDEESDEESEAEEEWAGIDAEEKEDVAVEQEEEPTPFVSVFPEEPAPSTAPETRDRDIVGVAQTGSGKTLAYGLPILSHILRFPPKQSTSNSDSDDEDGNAATRLRALILAPTRELALQVRAALSEVAIRTNRQLPAELQDPNTHAPRKREKGQHISVVALTGGMSVEKQKRQLQRGADILVATPGRLWDLIGEDDSLARAIKGIKFLVIDEADRMIENGHFAELENIVRLTRRKDRKEGDSDNEDEEYQDDFASAVTKHSKTDAIPARRDMRTFVFSATMSRDLQRNLKKRGKKNYKPGVPEDGMSSLDDLLLKLDFRDDDPEIIDLSPANGVVSTLKEVKVECLLPEKDVHLYHFLLRYPARTIVFLSSIDAIRRLHPLLVLLGLNVVQLHSGMQQRARLKSLDRFKASPNAVLLATDVAARGLDIPAVSHVVHYQLPRSADVYVHRSGRTARAGQEGLALQLVAPEEKQMQRLLMASLGKGTDFGELPADFSVLDQLKARIELAKKIEKAQHKATKEAHEGNWLRQAAEAMEIEIDSDMDFSDEDESSKTKKTKRAQKSQAGQVKQLRAELQAKLDKPIMMRGISAKYLTTRGRVGFVDQLVDGTGHSEIMGIDRATALENVPEKKKKQKKSKAKKDE